MTDFGGFSQETSALLSGLVRTIRPERTLSIGAGDATIALSLALESAVGDGGSPRLWSIDGGDSAVRRFIAEHSPRFDFVEPVDADLLDLPSQFFLNAGPLDFAWVDGGSLVDDTRLLRALWPHIGAGGILALHDPYVRAESTAQEDESVPSPLWNAITRYRPDDVEVLTLPALHDDRRTGIGLIRKRSHRETPRHASFTDEMVAMTGHPMRFETIGFHDENSLRDKATNLLQVLADDDIRTVLFAIGSGTGTLADLAGRTGLSSSTINKAVGRLFSLSIVDRVDERLVVDAATFDQFRSVQRTTPASTNMARYSRNRPDFLEKVASQISSTTWVSEQHVNDLCRFFDEDVATFRRELVDKSYLERHLDGSRYKRAPR